MSNRTPLRWVLVALGVVLILSVIIATGLGAVAVHPLVTTRILLYHLLPGETWAHLSTYFAADDGVAVDASNVAPTGAALDVIVWMLRLPRALLAGVVGASLAIVGVSLQAVTGNRLADPHLLGVSSGAALGAVSATLFFGAIWGPFTLPLMAFLGALLSIALVMALVYQERGLRADRLLMAGIAVSFVMLSAANLLLYLGDQRAASSVLFWMLGGLGLARWKLIAMPAAMALLCGVLLMLRRRELNAIMTGDIAAVSLGVSTGRLRNEVFVVGALLTGSMVAVSGAIGFIGLITPHICRRFVGAEHLRLLPTAGLMGAILLIWADVVARTAIAPEDLPIGVVTGIFGGVCLFILIRSSR